MDAPRRWCYFPGINSAYPYNNMTGAPNTWLRCLFSRASTAARFHYGHAKESSFHRVLARVHAGGEHFIERTVAAGPEWSATPVIRPPDWTFLCWPRTRRQWLRLRRPCRPFWLRHPLLDGLSPPPAARRVDNRLLFAGFWLSCRVDKDSQPRGHGRPPRVCRLLLRRPWRHLSRRLGLRNIRTSLINRRITESVSASSPLPRFEPSPLHFLWCMAANVYPAPAM
jgi:hypothetical protein